jgi:hypothetical protein
VEIYKEILIPWGMKSYRVKASQRYVEKQPNFLHIATVTQVEYNQKSKGYLTAWHIVAVEQMMII